MANPALIKRGEEQRERIMAFLRDYNAQHGISPTLHEIGDHVGIVSTHAVRGHLKRLQDEGRIQLRHNIPRAIRVVR